MSLSLIDTSNLITVTSIDADGNETTTVNYDYLEDATLIIIPDNATNGDVIKAMFPNIETFEEEDVPQNIYFSIEGDVLCLRKEWWNAPYKAESEDKE